MQETPPGRPARGAYPIHLPPPRMPSPRKLALGAGAALASLLVVLLVVPFMFRDRIDALLRREVNGAVNARLAWDGVGVSVLRDFPNVTLRLDRLSVVGLKAFERDTLLSMRQARLVLDLGSVIGHLRGGERIVVREIALNEPSVRLRVLPDGTKNWDIAKAPAQPGSESGSAVGVTLRELRITGGRLAMNDEQTHLVASVVGLDETLRGDFSRDRFVLATRTVADSVSVRFAGIPYLSRARIELNAEVDADLPRQRFTFANDTLRINALSLAFGGSVTLGKPDVAIDVAFSTPSTAFREILSLVPAIYAHDFERLQTAGTMSTSGRVQGSYGPNAFPALALRATVKNGAFRHPALPMPARDIFLDLAIDNPGGHVDRTVIDLKRLHAAIGGRPLDARLVVRTPVSDPDVDLRAVGSLDLADLARTVTLDGVTGLVGRISADVAMRARVSDVDAGRYDRVAASGRVDASRVALRSAAVPYAIAVDTVALQLTPRTMQLASFAARVGNSDVRATGTLDNVLGFALREQDLKGSASVSSTRFDLAEWKSTEETTEVIPVPPRIDFALRASAASVTYGALTLSNVRGGLRVKDQRVTLEELQMETLRGTVVANGFYETTVAGRPTFDMDLRVAGVDIPAAFAALTTVQKLVPVARWAQGSVTGTMGMRGPIGNDMMPVLGALSGKGAVETERLVVQGAPVLDRLATALSLSQLRKPALGAVRTSFEIADGRLQVKPFKVAMSGIDMLVSGSNGIDQSLKYDLGLTIPRALLGGSAGSIVADLASKAGPAGAALAKGETVQLAALVTGTVLDPAIRTNLAGMAGSARETVQNAVRDEVATKTAAVKQRVDSAAEQARVRARAEAERLVAEAEKQAASIRAEARTLAERTRREGEVRADSLLARATNPAARMAAKVGTDRMKREADQQAERIVREADARADALVAQARKQGDALAPPRAAGGTD